MDNTFGDSRLAHILLALCSTPAASSGTLAEKFQVSERTVSNDIKQLEAELKDCATIRSNQGRYVLHIFDAARFRAVRARLLAEERGFNSLSGRMDYVFGRLARSQAPLLTDELAYEMNMGRSTLIRDLKRLRAALEPYGLSIQGRTSQGLTLQGRERDIRQYILERCYDPLYRDYPLDGEITHLVEEAFAASPAGHSTRQQFERFLTVMLDRFLTGRPIGELSPAFYRLTIRPEFEAVNTLMEQIGAFLHTGIPVEEQLFTLLPVIGMRTPADAEEMRSIQLDPAMGPLQDKIFRQIRLEMELRIEAPELKEEFLYHLMFMLNRLRFRVRLKSPMVTEMREKYPLAWRMASIAARVIREECGMEVTEDEHSYLASYFSVFLEERGVRETPFRAAIVCGTGRVTARLIAAQLRRGLDSASELTLLSREKVTPERLAGFDLIFTTVELPCKTEQPVILIREVFHEQELRHKIEKAKYWNQVDVPILDNNWFVMVGLLDESRFFLLDDVETYDQALERMAASLIAQGQADPEFLSRLRAREEIGSTVFDNQVAIPHTVQSAGDKLVLAVGVCPRPVRQGKREVRTIFLMGLPKDAGQDTLLLRVYEEIISIAKDKPLLDKITSADSFPALLRALYRQA